MLDHVSIVVTDLARATRFYDAIMSALGYPCVYQDSEAIGYGVRNSATDDSHSYVTIKVGEGTTGGARHWALRARDRASVLAFYEAALASGGSDDEPPGERHEYHPAYFAAFVLDPDANRIEAVCHHT